MLIPHPVDAHGTLRLDVNEAAVEVHMEKAALSPTPL